MISLDWYTRPLTKKIPVHLPCVVRTVFVTLLMLFAGTQLAHGAMEPLEEEAMRTVNGQAGIAFRLNDWSIEGGDLAMTLDDPNGGELSISNLEVYDPDGLPNPDGIPDVYGSYPNDAGDELESGTFNDPFQINATNDGEGIIVMNWPTDDAAFEAADIGLTAHLNNNFLGRATIGNALWAEGTKLAAEIRPEGGVGLGIALRLDGDAWLRAYDGCCGSSYPARGGLVLEGVHGAGSYSCTPPNTSDYCFSGPLTWASLTDDRPLNIDFSRNSSVGNRTLVIERCASWNAGCPSNFTNTGAIGIQSLEFVGPTFNTNRTDLGQSVIGSIEIRHLRIEAPLN